MIRSVAYEYVSELSQLRLRVDGREVSFSEHDAIKTHWCAREDDQEIQELTQRWKNKTNYDSADLLVSRSSFGFRSFEPYRLDLPLSWAENPPGDPTWAYNLHRFVWVEWLVGSYLERSDAEYLEKALSLAVDWLDKNLSEEVPSPKSWHDHAAALRLERMLGLIEVARHHAPAADLSRLLEGLVAHARVLSQDAFYSARTNHGFEQARVLYLAARVMSECPESGHWRSVAIERLADEVAYVFRSGVHIENSPTYHQLVLRWCVDLHEKIDAADRQGVFPDLEGLLSGGLAFLAHMTRPDGTMPLIGDSETAKTRLQHFGAYGHMPEYEHLRYAVTQGKEGTAPDDSVRVFRETGYVTLRDRWHGPREHGETFHAVFKSGYLSQYHRHFDDLSLVVYAFGEDWVVDGGLYSYKENDPIRRYMRSLAAHNVVQIDGVSRESDRERIERDSGIREHRVEAGWHTIRATTGMYRGTVVERVLQYAPPHVITLTDRIGDPVRDKVTYSVRFHVPRDKRIQIEETGARVIIRSKKTGKRMIIESLGRMPDRIVNLRPSKTPPVQGLHSPQFRKLVQVHTVDFRFRGGRGESIVQIRFS